MISIRGIVLISDGWVMIDATMAWENGKVGRRDGLGEGFGNGGEGGLGENLPRGEMRLAQPQ